MSTCENRDRHARRQSASPLQQEHVRRQLAQLFGESLFGPWPQLQAHAGESWQRGRSKRWIWAVGLLLLLGACVFVVQWLVQPGLRHQADNRREHYARELKTFIGDGDLQRAAQFLTLVEGNAQGRRVGGLDASDPHIDLLVATEAALYRYFDASPERLRRIRPYVESVPSTPLRQIAALTVLSREERAYRIRELDQLRNDMPDRNDVDYLLATALDHQGEVHSSRQAWDRSAKLEPAWLGHRFEQAWFELRQNQVEAARKIAVDMLRVDPDSHWSKLAVECLALPPAREVGSIRGDAATPATTPVQTHFQRLTQSLFAARRDELSRAEERLAEAAAAIQYQPAFLLDAFDWFIRENQPALARKLTEIPQWPRDSKAAKAKLERLSNSAGGDTKRLQDSPTTQPAPAASSAPPPNQPRSTR